MRLNVYAEELTTDTQLVTKTVVDDEFGERTFYGVRVYLASPAVLHQSAADDDRSAVTFWVPPSRDGGHYFELVSMVLDGLAQRIDEAILRDAAEADHG